MKWFYYAHSQKRDQYSKGKYKHRKIMFAKGRIVFSPQLSCPCRLPLQSMRLALHANN